MQNFMHNESASWINDAESKLEDIVQAINNKCNWMGLEADKLQKNSTEKKSVFNKLGMKGDKIKCSNQRLIINPHIVS